MRCCQSSPAGSELTFIASLCALRRHWQAAKPRAAETADRGAAESQSGSGVKIDVSSLSGFLAERDFITKAGELVDQLAYVALGRVAADEPVISEIVVGHQAVQDVEGCHQDGVSDADGGLGWSASAPQARVLRRAFSLARRSARNCSSPSLAVT